MAAIIKMMVSILIILEGYGKVYALKILIWLIYAKS